MVNLATPFANRDLFGSTNILLPPYPILNHSTQAKLYYGYVVGCCWWGTKPLDLHLKVPTRNGVWQQHFGIAKNYIGDLGANSSWCTEFFFREPTCIRRVSHSFSRVIWLLQWKVGGLCANVPSGKLTVCCWKCPFTVDLPIQKNGGFPSFLVNVYQRISPFTPTIIPWNTSHEIP